MIRHLGSRARVTCRATNTQIEVVCRAEFSGGGSGSSDDKLDGIQEYLNRKWKGPSADSSAKAWPTDRSLEDAVEPIAETFLQSRWQALDSRLANRRSRREGPRGRVNLRKGEEDYWLASGAYDENESVRPASFVKDSSRLTSASAVSSKSSLAADLPGSTATSASGGALKLDVNVSAGDYARLASIPVRGTDGAAALAEVYHSSAAPILANMKGFKRGILLHDAKSGTVQSIQIWDDHKSFDVATTRAADENGSSEYASAMAKVAKHFLPGSEPEVSDFTVIGDFLGYGLGASAEDHTPIE